MLIQILPVVPMSFFVFAVTALLQLPPFCLGIRLLERAKRLEALVKYMIFGIRKCWVFFFDI